MKNNFLKLIMAAGFFLVSGIAAKAQVVTNRPNVNIDRGSRPVRPNADHYYWRSDDLVWHDGTYQLVPGGWEVRPGGGKWKKGHWAHVRGGQVWRPGHWR